MKISEVVMMYAGEGSRCLGMHIPVTPALRETIRSGRLCLAFRISNENLYFCEITVTIVVDGTPLSDPVFCSR
jgi:hypothetical protein